MTPLTRRDFLFRAGGGLGGIALAHMPANMEAWAEKPAAPLGFAITDDGKRLTIMENDAPVAVYNYGLVKPEGSKLKAAFARSCYLHPVYGLDGTVLTDDFPADHVHHRGIFWAWPRAEVNGREMDVWTLKDCRQRHVQFDTKEASKDSARIEVTNAWSFDEEPEKAMIRENVRMTFMPAASGYRVINFEISLTNESGGPAIIGGQTTSEKGYGGLCFRPVDGGSPLKLGEDESKSPFRFVASEGIIKEDRFQVDSTWAAMLLREQEGKPRNGVAFVQNSANPGYPHDGWFLRHYGLMGQSWPHTTPYELAPGESVTLRYRILITSGWVDAGVLGSLVESIAPKLKIPWFNYSDSPPNANEFLLVD